MSLVSRYLDPTLVERLNHLQLSGRRVVEGTTTGRYRSPGKGSSVEFRQHRPYVVGDEPRRLDWRVLARTDRPFVREYDEETNLRCMILLDCSGSMSHPNPRENKHEYAAKLAASLAYLMLGQTESVGLATIGADPQWLAPHAGTAQLARVMDVLERSGPGGAVDLREAMGRACERLGRRSLVVMISDFLQPSAPLRQGLARVAHKRHEMILLRVLHRDEVEFPFHSWRRFVGNEGERAMLFDCAVARRNYLDAFSRHERELSAACAQSGAELHRFVTERPHADALVEFLSHRHEARQRKRPS